MDKFELSRSRMPKKMVHVWVNGVRANFRLRENVVELVEPPQILPKPGKKALMYRILGKISKHRDLYLKGCESTVVVLYANDDKPQMDSFDGRRL